MSGMSLTIEQYAEIRADIDSGKLRDEALAYAGIDVDTWTILQQSWLEKMSTELERGRFELTNRYTKAFVERQRALDEALRAKPQEAQVPSTTAPSSPPFVEAPPSLSSPSESPWARASSDSLQSRSIESNQFDSYPHIPSSVQHVPTVSHFAVPADFDAGATLPPVPQAADSKATPFHAVTKPSFNVSEVLSSAGFPKAKPSAPVAVPVVTPSQHDDDDAARTVFCALPGGPALPFQAAPDHPLDSMKAFTPANPPRITESADHDLAATTAFVSLSAIPSSVLPFQAKSPPSSTPHPDPAELPVESDLTVYASLCAELAAWPHHVEAIFARYGLAPTEKRNAVDAAWKERLHRDPALYAQWQQSYRASFDRLKK